MLGGARVSMAIEEHGAGRQLLRFRCTPRLASGALVLVGFFSLLALLAALDDAWLATALLESGAVLLGLRALGECGAAEAGVVEALRDLGATAEGRVSGGRDARTERLA